MRKIAGYLTKNRSEKDQKITQSTHENGYIKPRKTFWRNSKQLLNEMRIIHSKVVLMNKILKAYFSTVDQGQGSIDASLPIWQGVLFLSAVA